MLINLVTLNFWALIVDMQLFSAVLSVAIDASDGQPFLDYCTRIHWNFAVTSATNPEVTFQAY